MWKSLRFYKRTSYRKTQLKEEKALRKELQQEHERLRHAHTIAISNMKAAQDQVQEFLLSPLSPTKQGQGKEWKAEKSKLNEGIQTLREALQAKEEELRSYKHQASRPSQPTITPTLDDPTPREAAPTFTQPPPLDEHQFEETQAQQQDE